MPEATDDGTTIPEAKYSFPVYPSSSVVSFVARVKVEGSVTKTIRGVVKSRPTAIKEYNEAVARGETAGFLEKVEEDVFTIKLGNIPRDKGTEVDVDIGYVTELKHDSGVDGIRFTIPTAIAPRYGASPEGVHSTSGTHVQGGLEMNVEIDMPSPVTSVQSPSHPIAVTLGSLGSSGNLDQEFNNAQAFAQLSQTRAFLESDFVLQILCKGSESPRAILETHADEHGAIDSAALMLTFVPKFVIPATSGTNKPRKEVIFMIDRSGSMHDKIEPLKSALKVFLKSLPPNDGIRFDLCSFGSRHSFLFDNEGGVDGSKLYSQSTLKKALEHVEGMHANYGGTEIFAPIKAICDRVSKRNAEYATQIQAGGEGGEKKAEWETEILLLTDGEVWDTKPLFDLVRDQTQEWRSEGKRMSGRAGIRLFTLGIGNDVSHGFVEGLATLGGGYAMTVGDDERFDGKVVRMLKAALGERVGGYRLTLDGIWGAAIETPEGDDDFEMVDKPAADAPEAPPPVSTPISLFDPSANPDAVHEAENKPKPSLSLTPPVIIRAPHIIPPLFPFNRTNIYLLLSPRTPSPSLCLPQKVTLRATTSGGQPLELTIPVAKASALPSKTLHQLATKKYLDNLKAGESWIHAARGTGEKLECIYGKGDTAKRGTIQLHSPESDNWDEDVFDEILKQEGERIGVQWGVVGNWTAFVALEEKNQEQRVLEDRGSSVEPPEPPYVRRYAPHRPAMGNTRKLKFQMGPQTPQMAYMAASPSPSMSLSAGSRSVNRSKGIVQTLYSSRVSGGGLGGGGSPSPRPPGDSSPQDLPTSDADAVERFIELQGFEGYWDLSLNLLNCFFAKISSAKLSIPSLKGIAAKELSVPAEIQDRVLATALAAVWLQHRLAGEKDTWELVVDKAMDWLRAAVTGDVSPILTKAKEILEIV